MKTTAILSLLAYGAMMLSGYATDGQRASIHPADPSQHPAIHAPVVKPPSAPGFSPGIPENNLADTPAAL